MQIVNLKETDSTNDFLLKIANNDPNWEGVVTSDYQSSGKGMGTNRWESEKGKNLLFSILLHPTWLPVTNQYLLSMTEAVAICETLQEYADHITIKWPNDIYWKDRKLSGTRIDANLNSCGISDMIIGTGININQEHFLSDAPNPISLKNITGKEYERKEILETLLSRFEHYNNILRNGGDDIIINKYHQNLYRKQGLHPYKDAQGSTFMAQIVKVMPNGVIILKTSDGIKKEYMFKEVEFIIQ